MSIVHFLLEKKLVSADFENILNFAEGTNLFMPITLAKQGYDLSLIPDVEDKFMEHIDQLKQAGLRKAILLGYYIRNIFLAS